MSAIACVGWFVFGAIAGGSFGFVAFALLASSAESYRHTRPRGENDP